MVEVMVGFVLGLLSVLSAITVSDALGNRPGWKYDSALRTVICQICFGLVACILSILSLSFSVFMCWLRK